jgi:hypothetical protein
MMDIGDWAPAECMMCGKPEVISHVMVWDEQERVIGRICATHSLYEVIFWNRGSGTQLFVSVKRVAE